RQIAEELGFTPDDLLRAVPGVDFISTGLVQDGFSARASNGPRQGQLLVMADYRNTRLPSLGVNTSYLYPFTSEDLERVEIVRGPGAAIYGPDAHSGVVHFVTRSPFESQGLSLSVAGGQRSVRALSGRFASAPNPRVAFKVSGTYFE